MNQHIRLLRKLLGVLLALFLTGQCIGGTVAFFGEALAEQLGRPVSIGGAVEFATTFGFTGPHVDGVATVAARSALAVSAASLAVFLLLLMVYLLTWVMVAMTQLILAKLGRS